ncbi:MAG: DUF2461 domain-containing protein [Planctomycetota bacterium]|jgi:uncharacterized protein (TIGR02453 family)
MGQSHFDPKLFKFIRDLKKNNDRDWFQKNKKRYEQYVKEAAFSFIEAFAEPLHKISPHFTAIPKATGGSLFRIYRDTRFGKDKSPYKTHVGIHFRHEQAKDAHAPGFYLHLAPEGCFAGMGIWHPDGPALKAIRHAIVDNSAAWKRLLKSKTFNRDLELVGDSLKRPPRGYDKEHPLIDDLRRKDFIATTKVSRKDVLSPGFVKQYTQLCKASKPLMKFLCDALSVPF